MPRKTIDKRVRLRPETRRKWDAITRKQRWTDTEAADALADEFIEKHGIPVEEGDVPPSSGGQTATATGASIPAPAPSSSASRQGAGSPTPTGGSTRRGDACAPVA